MAKKYGLISVVAGVISVFMLTFLAGIVSMVTAYFGMKAIPEEGASVEERKELYFCMAGLALTIIGFLLHSYVF